MPGRRSLRSRTSLTSQVNQAPARTAMGRPRRTASGSTGQSVTVARATSRSPDDAKKSIRLTVKMPSSKLREATSGSSPILAANSRDSLGGGEIMSGTRGSRAKRSIVVESESEEEDEDEEEDVEEEVVQSDDEQQEEEDEEQEDDGEEEDEEEEEEEEVEDGVEDVEDESVDVVADVDAETDADADGDIEMEDAPLLLHPPVLKMTGPAQKPSLTLTPAQGETENALAKKVDLADDDDEELSELDSEAEEEDAEDAEGVEVGDMEGMDQDDEGRSQQEGSRASTPDVSKMTKRQRSRLDQVMGKDYLQLPMGATTKKHLTAEEHAMRRVEMARRRKNLSEKRNEEEKMDTINRLLKKQAPKRRGKLSAAEISANAAAHEDLGSEVEAEKPNAVYVRWVSNRQGFRAGVPGEWLAGPAGRVFGGGGGGSGIEIVEG